MSQNYFRYQVFVHNCLESLYKHIPRRLLPEGKFKRNNRDFSKKSHTRQFFKIFQKKIFSWENLKNC